MTVSVPSVQTPPIASPADQHARATALLALRANIAQHASNLSVPAEGLAEAFAKPTDRAVIGRIAEAADFTIRALVDLLGASVTSRRPASKGCPMGRHRHPISRAEAVHLLALAREVQPVGAGPSFTASASQIRAARAVLSLTADGLATMTGTAGLTVANVEGGINTDRDAVGKIRQVLEGLGAVFVRQGDCEAVAWRA